MFVEAVGQGCVRFGRLERHTFGKMSSGSGNEGEDGAGDVTDGKLGFPAVVDNHDSPKAVVPPLQDGVAIKGDFATCFVKEYLAACTAQDGNREEIVDKTRELMS
jgi:hypothetical protein